MTKWILFISILCFSSQLLAKVVIISDVDDTIKMANSMSKLKGKYYFLKGRPFVHMRDMFREMEDVFVQKRNDAVQFYYVTAAPEAIVDVDQWLKKHSFPAGKTWAKRKGDGDTFHYKLERITWIVENELKWGNPEFYFFGDNSQYDAPVYLTVAKKFGIDPSRIFIRDVSTWATDWGPYQTMRLEGVNYFFSERDLLENSDLTEFFNGKDRESLKVSYLAKEIVPMYTLETFEKRLNKYYGCRISFKCKAMANTLAKKFWNQYYQIYR